MINYDIKIYQDGTPVLQYGDFVPIDFSGYVSQRIYQALMTMDLSLVTGMQLTKVKELEEALTGYLVSYFSRDGYIVPQGITATVIPMPGDDRIKYSVTYKGSSPDGSPIEVTSDLAYSVAGGAVLSVDYEPKWLTTPTYNTPKTLTFPITISEVTSEVELPLEPSTYNMSEDSHLTGFSNVPTESLQACPIYLLTAAQLDGVDNTTEEAFTIQVRSNRSKYQLSAFVTSFIRRESIIDSYSFDSSSEVTDFMVITEYGEPTVIITDVTSGTITGSVTLRKAVQVADKYIVKSPIVSSPAFPLRRHRGKYFATFPKSIQLGNYYIRYTAISEE